MTDEAVHISITIKVINSEIKIEVEIKPEVLEETIRQMVLLKQGKRLYK